MILEIDELNRFFSSLIVDLTNEEMHVIIFKGWNKFISQFRFNIHKN